MKWLICGTRKNKKEYKEIVYRTLSVLHKPDCIIEGCCPDSADQYAEDFAEDYDIPIKHFPSNPGNYLKRNIEMVEQLENKPLKRNDLVIAFWDGYSYGTAHTIAHAVMRNIPVIIKKV